jgi:UDP-glucose 4-epimerase
MTYHPNESKKIILTGGSGFLGSHLLKNKLFEKALVIGRSQPKNHKYFQEVSFLEEENLSKIFSDVEVIVHTAAKAHEMGEKNRSSLEIYRKINTESTLRLARQAALAGVKKFIFISTIKVLGEGNNSCSFKYDDPLNPQDYYSISKAEAEEGLKLISKSSKMEIVIIRPPLVYGKGVKGNFRSLLKLIRMKFPLPLGNIKNKRSLVSVDNLTDLIVTCINHPNAKNQTFLVSDDNDLSTTELLSMLAEAGGFKAFLFHFPGALLYFSLKLLGKLAIYNRLYGSMCIDIEHTKSKLGWYPPFRVKESLKDCWTGD